MSTFAIDQGNTSTKVAFFNGSELLRQAALEDETLLNDLSVLMEEFTPSSGIFCSVRKEASSLITFLQSQCELRILNADTSLPIGIDYETPLTLGADRKANAAAAISQWGDADGVIVDCGTCITYTLVSGRKLIGGAISPGLKMRLKALNHYTGRLPALEHSHVFPPAIGKSTEGSIRAGVELAIVLEVEKMIECFCSQLTDANVILTGGMMPFFVQHLKSPIFARPFLTLTGLHEILLFNKK